MQYLNHIRILYLVKYNLYLCFQYCSTPINFAAAKGIFIKSKYDHTSPCIKILLWSHMFQKEEHNPSFCVLSQAQPGFYLYFPKHTSSSHCCYVSLGGTSSLLSVNFVCVLASFTAHLKCGFLQETLTLPPTFLVLPQNIVCTSSPVVMKRY